MFLCRKEELDDVNKLSSEVVLDGTFLLAEKVLKKNGEKIFAWAEDRFTN